MARTLAVSKQIKGNNVILAVGGNRAAKLSFVDLLHNWGITTKHYNECESDGARIYLNVPKDKLIHGLTSKTICNFPDATLKQFKGKRYGAWRLAKARAIKQVRSWQTESIAIVAAERV